MCLFSLSNETLKFRNTSFYLEDSIACANRWSMPAIIVLKQYHWVLEIRWEFPYIDMVFHTHTHKCVLLRNLPFVLADIPHFFGKSYLKAYWRKTLSDRLLFFPKLCLNTWIFRGRKKRNELRQRLHMVSHRYNSSNFFPKLVIFPIFSQTSACRFNIPRGLFLVEWELLKISQCYEM